MNITKTISLLDELRGKATQGNGDEKRSYLIALDANFPVLRQSALDSERYRKAGETLVAFFENQFEGRDTDITQEEIELALKSYRQAVEQKEV